MLAKLCPVVQSYSCCQRAETKYVPWLETLQCTATEARGASKGTAEPPDAEYARGNRYAEAKYVLQQTPWR